MAKQARHGSSRIRRRRTACISRLCIDPKFTTLLIEASKGASVRMPDGLNGDEILEWFSLPWDEAVRRDPTFRERHLHRPVTLKSEIVGYPAGTRATVSGVHIEPRPCFTVRTHDGQLVIVGLGEVLFDDGWL
jgi:hypothetical protein